MTPIDPHKQPDAFPSAVAFVIALLPVLMLVFTFLPDGSDCAAKPCGYWFTRMTTSTILIAAGAILTFLWLALGLGFFFTRLRAMAADRARQAVFLYALLTCALCFLILPTAVVSVLIVFVLAEIVLRLPPRKPE